jgi:acyl-homoserine-lactone acylase
MLRLSAALWLVPLLVACGRGTPDDGALSPYDDAPGPLDARLRYTEYGVPHIDADDYASLGYGMGYAQARDNLCVIADGIVRVTSQRPRFFGEAFVDEAFGWLHLGVVRQAEDAWFDLEQTYRDTLLGYTAGYNRALEEGLAGEACAGQPWVAPINHIELLSWLLALGLDGSGALFVDIIGGSQPPATATSQPVMPRADLPLVDALAGVRDPRRGSNGWALGSEVMVGGGGGLLSNTHFPHLGEKRWHEVHLTIPGDYDVYGVALQGVPVVNIGFNADVAWTHTVSYAPRFTAYRLSLVDGDPTSYLVDGTARAMTASTYSLDVLGDSGRTRTVSRTLYRSDFGPLIAIAPIGWSTATVLAARDVNENNLAMLDVWFGMGRATDLDSFVAAHETQGIPWVYTLAASAEGESLFADTSRVPALSDDQLAAYRAFADRDLFARQFASSGAILLPGDTSEFVWETREGAAVPGLLPPLEGPLLRGRGASFNANDAPWIARNGPPLLGYSALYGEPDSAPAGRTLMNARLLGPSAEGGAAGEDDHFDLDELEAAAMGMRSLWAERLREALVARATGAGPVSPGGGAEPVDLADAVEVLDAWDGTFQASSVGAILFREWLAAAADDPYGLTDDEGGGLFAVPFDPDSPFDTPRDLRPAPESGDDPVLVALASAVSTLADAGIGLDDPLGDWQRAARVALLPDRALPGGGYWEGTIGIADYSGGVTETLLPRYLRPEVLEAVTERTADGYPVNNGNSWVMTMAFGDDGPEARALMVYSQSSNPESPHYDDQGDLASAGTLRPVHFREADIAAAVVETVELSE